MMNEPEEGEKVMVVEDGRPSFVTVEEVGRNHRNEMVVWVKEMEDCLLITEVYTKEWLNSMFQDDNRNEIEENDVVDKMTKEIVAVKDMKNFLERIESMDNCETISLIESAIEEYSFEIDEEDITPSESGNIPSNPSCPYCGNELSDIVSYVRGDESIDGFECRKCGKSWTFEEWDDRDDDEPRIKLRGKITWIGDNYYSPKISIDDEAFRYKDDESLGNYIKEVLDDFEHEERYKAKTKNEYEVIIRRVDEDV